MNANLKACATTIAFAASAVAISVIMWALESAGHEVIPGLQVENWFRQGAFTVIYAMLAGFLVDLIRWLSAMAWVAARQQQTSRPRNRRTTEVCLSD